MKLKRTEHFLIFFLFIGLMLDLTASFAKGYQGYQKMNLPEGAIARLGKGSIYNIAYSPDGNKLAVACRDGVWIYNAHSGQELALLSSGPSRSLAFSPDGRTLVTSGKHNLQSGGTDLHLWDATTWQYKMPLTSSLLKEPMSEDNDTTCIAFSPDGRTLASGSYNHLFNKKGAVLLWDTATWRHKKTFKGQFYSIAFSPNSRTLATAGESGVKIRDASTGRVKVNLGGASDFTWTSVAFSPNGRFFASGTDDLQIWDTATWNLKETLTGTSKRVFAFSPDSSTFATTVKNGGIWIWNATTWKRTGVNTRQDNVSSITFSPDSTTLASASRNGTLEQFEDGVYKTTINHNPPDPSANPVFSPDGKKLATCVDDDLVLWDVITGESTRFVGDYGGLNAVAFSPDGNKLASGGQYGKVMVWDITTKHKTTFEDRAKHVIDSIAYSPDGDTLVTTTWSGAVELWNTATGKVKGEFTDVKLQNALDANSNWIKSVNIDFSPDGHTLVTSVEGIVLLWNIANRRVKHEFSGSFIGFSRDSSTMAIRHEDTIEFWDTTTKKLKTRLNPGNRVFRAIASSDGSTIAISGSPRWSDTTIISVLEVWDVASGELRATLSPEHRSSIMLSPNGDILASWNFGAGVLLWEVPSLSEPSMPTLHFQYPPMYWISGETGTLHRFTGIKEDNLVPSVQNATGLALDVGGRKLYWTEKTSKRSGRIRRASLDGSNVQLVKELTSVPRGITIDTVNSKLYLTNSRGKVQRLNFDGSNFEGNLITGLNSPKYVALDVDGGKVYWTESPRSIRRANLDGSNVETFTTTEGDVGGIAITGGKVYWAEKINESIGKISYMNFNGSNVKYLAKISHIPDVPPSIAVDPKGSKLYWSNSWGRILFVNLNGKNDQYGQYLTDLHKTPGHIAIGISSTKPRPTDINEDGTVDQNDLLLVATNLGQRTPTNSRVDVNGDGEVTIADLLLVIKTFEGVSDAAAPAGKARLTPVDRETLESLIHILRTHNDGSSAYQQVLTFLHSLLTARPPDETRLLPNYPNPFNPETWIPYHLAKSANVKLQIHSVNGTLVRTLTLGYQPPGVYQRRSRAAYWDGKNEVGEPVASGVYFYTLTAGDFTATRKLLIRK